MVNISNEEASFIPGNVPSLKNSKVKTSRGIFPSKTVTKYIRGLGISSYSSSKKTVSELKRFSGKRFIDYFKEEELNKIKNLREKNIPICLGFHFIRNNKKRFDFGNACQILCDLMTAYDIIEDDNMDCLIPFPIMVNDKWFSYDKENPGVLIKVINE